MSFKLEHVYLEQLQCNYLKKGLIAVADQAAQNLRDTYQELLVKTRTLQNKCWEVRATNYQLRAKVHQCRMALRTESAWSKLLLEVGQIERLDYSPTQTHDCSNAD